MRKKMNTEDLSNMMCESIDAELTIRKRVGTQEVEVSGGTSLVVMDIYMIMKALEQASREAMPMFKNERALKKALKSVIDIFELKEEKNHE